MSETKRRLLERLKRTGATSAPDLAQAFDLTDVAIRRHLMELEEKGLVERRTQPPEGRGRPAVLWSLSGLAQGVFPERHADLAVSLIEAITRTGGSKALDGVIDARSEDQIRAYRKRMPGPEATLRRRVDALARERSNEGYMAEVKKDKDGSLLLVEHNCPICEAAERCMGLCRAELEVFREVIGPDATVERTQHLLSGDERCVYRIRAGAKKR